MGWGSFAGDGRGHAAKVSPPLPEGRAHRAITRTAVLTMRAVGVLPFDPLSVARLA